MTDPLKNYSLAAITFIVGLLTLLGIIYFTDKAHGAESIYYDHSNYYWSVLADEYLSGLDANDAYNSEIGISRFNLNDAGSFRYLDVDRFWLATSTTGSVYAELRSGCSGSPATGSHVATSSAITISDIPTSTTGVLRFDFGESINVETVGQSWCVRFYSTVTSTSVHNFAAIRVSYNEYAMPDNSWFKKNVSGWQQWSPTQRNTSFRLLTESENLSSTISWRFPEDGITTPDFSNWVVALTNLDPNITSYIKINAYLSTSSVTSSEVGTQFNDYSSISPQSSTPNWSFPKSETLTPGQDGDRIWTLTAYVCGEPYCFIPLSSSTITITTNFSSTIPDTPYTNNAGPFDTLDDYLYNESGDKITRDQVNAWAAGEWCTDTPADWTDIGGGISWGVCRVFEVLLKPSDASKTFLYDQALTFKKIFPFRYVFDAADQTKLALAAAENDASLTLTLDMREAFDNETASVTLLSSSSLQNLLGATSTTEIFTTERYIIWLTTFGTIVGTLISFL